MTERCDGGKDQVSRRSFIGSGGALVGAAAIGSGLGGLAEAAPQSASPDDDLGPIPRRVLGRTGAKVSILGFGTADMGEGPQDTPTCAAVFAEAIDRGINYIDTARIYGNAEEALGQVLKTRRDKTFLVTKCMTDTRKDAQRSFETSLRTMGVDHVDLLHLHSTGDRDLDTVLGKDGAWEYLLEMKKAGKTRFVGITGHNRPHKFLRMLETKQVDVMMVAMNFVDRHVYGFEDKVLPKAREVGTAVMAMKVFGGVRGGFAANRQRQPSQVDPIYLQIALRYSLGLEGVTGVVVGCHDEIELRQNIRYVLHAPPLSKVEHEALLDHGERIAPEWGARFGPVS
jgi:predicted aldo/keto reductase-like oxidoreductase